MPLPLLELPMDEAPTNKMSCSACGNLIDKGDIRILFGKKGRHIQCYEPINNMCFQDFHGSGSLSANNKIKLRKYIKQWRATQFEARRKKKAEFAKKQNRGGFPTSGYRARVAPDLPESVLSDIFTFLSPFDLSQAMRVSKGWHKASFSDIIWKGLVKMLHPAAVANHKPDNMTWKDVFSRFCLTLERESGQCGICGKDSSAPFEPSMEFLCSRCPVPFADSKMIPVTQIKKLMGSVTPDDILEHTGYGPFRTRIDKTVGFAAWATITVPAYPQKLLEMTKALKEYSKEKQREVREDAKRRPTTTTTKRIATTTTTTTTTKRAATTTTTAPATSNRKAPLPPPVKRKAGGRAPQTKASRFTHSSDDEDKGDRGRTAASSSSSLEQNSKSTKGEKKMMVHQHEHEEDEEDDSSDDDSDDDGDYKTEPRKKVRRRR